MIGELPIGASEQRALEETNGGEDEKVKGTEGAAGSSATGRPKVLADGTYATETAYTTTANVKLEAVKVQSKCHVCASYALAFIDDGL